MDIFVLLMFGILIVDVLCSKGIIDCVVIICYLIILVVIVVIGLVLVYGLFFYFGVISLSVVVGVNNGGVILS